MSVTPLELARVAATAADDRKATDICLIDLTEASDVCDYFVVCSGSNNRLIESVIDEIEEKVRVNCDERPFSIEGRAEGTWVLMDYGTVVVHVFLPETRDYYRIERLWGDAPRVRLDLEGAMPIDEAAASDVESDDAQAPESDDAAEKNLD